MCKSHTNGIVCNNRKVKMLVECKECEAKVDAEVLSTYKSHYIVVPEKLITH